MQLKGLIANHVSALMLAAYAASVPALAHADTIAWASWSSATAGTPGSATGSIGSISVTYSGQTSGLTSVPTWTPASSFTGGPVGNAPPNAPSIQIEGGSTITETITFSSVIVDPVFAIWSLGSGSAPAIFDFESKSGETFSIVGGGPSHEFGGSTITVDATDPQIIHGSEGNGVIQFDGSFSSITFTTPEFEDYYAFTVGYDVTQTDPTIPGTVPEPATLSLFGLGLLALPMARRALSRGRS
jgi:hypothetical protein